MATAGVPWGAMLADRLNLPFSYVRSKPKEHGLGKMIEGDFNPTLPTILIEDLFSTGKSVLQAYNSIINEYPSAAINGLLALFSYELKTSFESRPDLKLIAKSVLQVNDILKHQKIDEANMVPYRHVF